MKISVTLLCILEVHLNADKGIVWVPQNNIVCSVTALQHQSQQQSSEYYSWRIGKDCHDIQMPQNITLCVRNSN